MTAPNKVEKGDIVLATIRCSQRKFRLAPSDPEIAQIIAYCLAHYANHYGITLHAVVVMSTHIHLLFTDNDANRGDFLRDFHAKVAC